MKRAEEIAAALAAEDPEQRRRAVESLTALASEVDAPARYVLQALGDDDWRVRKQAIQAAVELAPAHDLLSGLVQVLLPSDNVGLRNAAV